MKEENSNAFDKGEEPFTCRAIMNKPCFYFPLFFFQISGWLGFILLMASYAGASNVGMFAAFILTITGVWAAYELRAVGTLSEQIKWLRRISKALSSACDELQGEVTELSDETQELKQNCEDLHAETGELDASVTVMCQQNDEIKGMQKALREQSKGLQSNLTQLHVERENLSKMIHKMEEDGEETRGSLNQFSSVSNALQNNAAHQNQHLHEILEKTKRDFNRMNELAEESDELLFWKRFYAIRRRTGDNMTQRHFRRFQANLRSKFGDVMREHGLDFEKLDVDGDGVLDHEELTQFIDTLISASWREKNKSNGGIENQHEEMI